MTSASTDLCDAIEAALRVSGPGAAVALMLAHDERVDWEELERRKHLCAMPMFIEWNRVIYLRTHLNHLAERYATHDPVELQRRLQKDGFWLALDMSQ